MTVTSCCSTAATPSRSCTPTVASTRRWTTPPFSDSSGTRNEDFVPRSAAARAALVSGTPLKMVITARSFDVDRGDAGSAGGAAADHSVRTFEVTRVERATFDRAIFDVPDGYTRKDNKL